MRNLTIIFTVICMALSITAAKADRRVAFVVGNGAYENVASLPNPPVDAKLMAATLRSVGFEVIEGTNLTRDKMTQKLLDFGKKAQGADVAVFFYAGHGIAIGGSNYLLPIDADIKSEMDVKLGAAINVDVTLDQTMGDAKVKLVFLDACRDNPFAAQIKSNSATRSINVQTGLAEMKSGEGTLIAFATGPGQTALDGDGSNSPFTRALVDNITKPGVEIQQAMTAVRAQVNEETHKGQLPWGHTNLIGAVYLNPAAAQSASVQPGSAPAANPEASAVELEFWRSVKESNSPDELNAYLSKYPNGQFKALALARVASLESNAGTQNGAGIPSRDIPSDTAAVKTDEGSQLTEDQIGLDRGQRRDVQRRLVDLGFDSSRPTGVFTDQTRSGIKRWQAARGYPATGYFNKTQYMALLEPDVTTASDVPPPAVRSVRHKRPGLFGNAPSPTAFFRGLFHR